MESRGEDLDDQGSGWFEVKKKHRSSSKFSLQSWVGSFSGKNASSFQRNQPSTSGKGGYSQGKRRSNVQVLKAEQNLVIHGQGSASSAPVLNEDKKGELDSEKSVVKQSESSKSPQSVATVSTDGIEDTRIIPTDDSPELVHKIKWGDLADDALVLHHENNGGAEIKFGDIGEDALVVCRKHENGQDLVSQVPCNNMQEDKLVATSTNVVMTPTTNKDKISVEKFKEVNEIMSEDVEVSIMTDKMVDIDSDASSFKYLTTEHVKCTIDDKSGSSGPSGVEDEIVVKLQLPVVISEAGESKLPKLPIIYGVSSTVMITRDIQPLPLEKCGPEISEESIMAASVEDYGGPPGDTIHDDLSKSQMMSAPGECDTGESKERFRQRLWCFLFENLNRAVDELYLLCELECDLEQMKEAILVLEEAASDFKELTSRVAEFENVKRSSPKSADGTPFTLKSDHRRPHALSWEVRRMTTSPHQAEILSSSLEAFQKIQKERASKHPVNDAKTLGLESSSCHLVSGDNLKIIVGTSDLMPSPEDSVVQSSKHSGDPHLALGNLSGEIGRSSSVNFVQNGCQLSQNSSFSDVVSFRLPLKETSAASTAGKYRKEQSGSEVENVLYKRDKMLAESSAEKIPKSVDHTKRSEKDKERRNGTSRKFMDAWKEKRNWEDILSSPFRVSSRISHSPGISRKSAERARTLHDKLMFPEKKKKKKNALDLKREAEEKHARAMRIRSELENERVQKLQRTSEKLNRVNEWQAVRNMKLREGMYARHQRSESRHEAYIAQVVRRAGDESSKVNEVRFITSLNEENKKLILRQKLHDSELRRAEKFQVMKTKQKEDMAREEAVLERRKLIEAEKLQRLAETQRKKEEAQVRREEERKASSAARESRALEQLRRKEERAKAQQEEAELLAQKLAERLSESEQRRKFYLEQIRERASMDFRDQLSPLLRRSMNKEGQGRSTQTNNGEEYQGNSVSGLEGSTLATGNATLQHSMKRRSKRIRQRLMALKYEFSEPPVGSENSGIGYRTAVGAARVKIGRWLQELQKLRQARKEGAASIGLITAEMIKFLEGKDPELQASRQAGLLDFIASALPASHASKPEACQVTIQLLKLLRVVLSTPANRSYFLAQNLLPPIIPMLSAALENYIKIAASLNVPGGTTLPSNKTSVENFESISEVLDGFLWTVTTIVGHISSDERELQMRDGLLELLVAYQVIHRLRDLFALYDRPQVEGSPFPSSILLSIYLLVVLTSSPGASCFIDWESFPNQLGVGSESPDAKVAELPDSGYSLISNTCGENRFPLSVLNGGSLASLPDVPEDKPLDESCGINKSDESVSIGKDGEYKLADGSLKVNTTIKDKIDVQGESPKILNEKEEKILVDIGAELKNENLLSLKQPLAFLLSAISETGLVSLPSLLTAVLLQANNKFSSEQASYVLPSNFEEVATGVLKVLNNLAILDITFMQRMLARPDLKMEFFHLISFLLSHCTSKWKVASDQVGLLLLESLLLLGYFALFHPGNQAVLRWGKSPTILHKVCDLPFMFFSDPQLMPVLAGTLVAASYGCEQNKDVVQQELSMDMLLSLLRSCRNVISTVRSNPTLQDLTIEEANESNQQGSELRKSQGDISVRSSRYGARNPRISLAKGAALGNSIRYGKIRNQRDGKPTKSGEELALKNNLLASETSMMLHYRFPSDFIDRADQFFSAGSINMGNRV
ncbi:hypothetical protein CFOL_v3_11784 [Cephalotus follicularis]|uniref:S phase cyclin A-associated protein in the endoplasmic reticulum N-terminal domain-containing protein n=1 Tax=Cephalotus follicularis TaxID=3775 RepID=A0A1Q3BJV8_CEPFO|nr:hypothetical protein CFOL_v3_11784 [Cephalotus follicularis]